VGKLSKQTPRCEESAQKVTRSRGCTAPGLVDMQEIAWTFTASSGRSKGLIDAVPRRPTAERRAKAVDQKNVRSERCRVVGGTPRIVAFKKRREPGVRKLQKGMACIKGSGQQRTVFVQRGFELFPQGRKASASSRGSDAIARAWERRKEKKECRRGCPLKERRSHRSEGSTRSPV